MKLKEVIPVLATHTSMIKVGDCMVLIFGNSDDGKPETANYHTGVVIPGCLVNQIKQMINQFDTSPVKLYVDANAA